jgi:hypothetical protein
MTPMLRQAVHILIRKYIFNMLAWKAYPWRACSSGACWPLHGAAATRLGVGAEGGGHDKVVVIVVVILDVHVCKHTHAQLSAFLRLPDACSLGPCPSHQLGRQPIHTLQHHIYLHAP